MRATGYPAFHKMTALCLAMGISAGVSTQVSASVITADWTGLVTLLDPGGYGLQNAVKPYYYDVTWGYGFRTQVSGTFTYDTVPGAGTMTVDPFPFFNSDPNRPATFQSVSVQAIGDGNGGEGNLVQVNMLFDWGSSANANPGIVLDATGFFGALAGGASTSQVIDQATTAGSGATPASNGIVNNNYPIGPVPMATTTLDSTFPTTGDGIGGIPMTNGPFVNFNMNFDFTAFHITSVTPVPLPAAAWLFGAGLLGLVGAARRRG